MTCALRQISLIGSLASIAWIVSSASGCGRTAAAPVETRAGSGRYEPVIPRTWDEQATRTWLLPLADGRIFTFPPATYYDRMPVRPIYRSYPVYHPDREPAGYLDRLKSVEPEVIWDANGKRPELRTADDWRRAGEIVYDSPVSTSMGGYWVGPMADRSWIARSGAPVAKDGSIPSLRYVVRERGVVEFGVVSCGMCHTRVLPNGTIVKGTQGNFPTAQMHADVFRRTTDAEESAKLVEFERAAQYRYHGAPWMKDDASARVKALTAAGFIETFAGIVPGVYPNHNGSIFYPARIAHLIGLKDRRYLDSTGHHRHRDARDLMRFADFHQLGTYYASYGDDCAPTVPPPAPKSVARYSDEQLHALAAFLYALEAPPNPNVFDAEAARGEQIFDREGCAGCHAPPSYTTDELTPVDGFEVPPDHPERSSILRRSVHTDPTLALRTRKGTGFYKVPTLRGVWFRGPFGHNGSALTLEDWFDARRLEPGYVPTGWKGPPGNSPSGVAGHAFGLHLSGEERHALIAFLRTL